MPQLDILTFCVQVALIFFFSWGFQQYLISKILPRFIVNTQAKKALWDLQETMIVWHKYYSCLSFLELIKMITKYVKLISLILKKSNLLTGTFSRTLFKSILKSFLRVSGKKNTFIKIYFYKSIFFSKINLLNNFGQKNKLNFLYIKNSTYFFVQNYLINLFLKKKLYKRIMIREVRADYLLNEIIALKNKVNVKRVNTKLSYIFRKIIKKNANNKTTVLN